MRRIGTIAVVLGLLVSAGGCDRDTRDEQASTSTTVPGCPAPTVAAGRSTHTITVAGVDRTYVLFVPHQASKRAPLPLVFDLHGHGSNATQQLAYTQIETPAERDGWIVVAPEGAGTPQAFDLAGTTDLDFIARTAIEVGASVCVDSDRVYAMGMSNGGAMSSVLACRAQGMFAAVAPVAAIVYVEAFCDGTRPVPVMAFAGTADPVVPFDGGRVNCCGNPTIGSAPAAMAGWARHNGCDEAPAETKVGADVTTRSWANCDGGADTVFQIVEGGGHTWPGGIPIDRLGKTTSSIDATTAILDFFRNHPRPAR